MRSDDVRGKQFSTHRPGYDKKQVAAFLEAAGLRLAAMESTDRPAGPLVSGALLVGWAEWADSVTFSKASWRRRGYLPIEVDAFREEIRDTFLGATRSPVKSDNVRGTQFSSTTYFTHDEPNNRYDKNQVDAFLDAAGIRLAAMESTDRPAGPLVSGAILARWAEWADSTRFSTSRVRVGRYDAAEVDAFREAIRDTFLGVSGPPLTWRAPPGKQFTATRRLRPGYDPEQVDAFLDNAEPRLAAMRATDKGGHDCRRPIRRLASHKPHHNSRERALRGERSGGNRGESHRRAICQIAGLDEAILARNRKPSLGIDVARYGDSETVIMQREGGWARIAWAGGKLSTIERPATLCTSRSNERRAGSRRLGEDVRRRRWSGRRSL